MSNDWLIQGFGDGADYAYLLNVTSPTTIDVTLCSPNTDYDSKLEIFTATGKKLYDKRSSIKEKENKRNLDRVKKKKN